jgi:hypothetical protein
MFATPLLQAQRLEKLPYSGGVLMGRAIRSGRIQLPSRQAVTQVNPDLTCSPAPCAFTPVEASGLGAQPANEYPFAANPGNAMQLLTGANDYNCPGIQGFYATNDGGTTWTRKCFPLLSGGSGDGDPVSGYDLNNVAYAGGIQSAGTFFGIVVSSSTDNGTTWGAPVKAVPAELGYLADKPWMQVDDSSGSALKNSIYISSTQFASNSDSQIWVAHSTDGGKTWTDKAVGTKQHYPTAVDQFSDLAVGSDGTVYATWIRCPANGSAGDCGGTVTKIMFSKSTDGGNTWSAESQATTTTLAPDACFCGFYGSLPNTSERISDIPANAASGSGSTANVWVTYYNWTGTQMQIMAINSKNGGSTWGTPARVNKSNTGDQFFPWVNFASNGRKLGFTWMDRRNDASNVKFQPFFASNTPSGFTKDHALDSKLSDPNKDGFGSGFFGDYYTNVWSGRALYINWCDTNFNNSTCQEGVGGVQF